jgi:hypothetical protein
MVIPVDNGVSLWRIDVRLIWTIVLALVGMNAAAQIAVGQAPAKNGLDYDAVIARARALLKEGKLKDALTSSEEAIALNDKRWEAYVTAASAYSAQQLFDDAIGMLQLALPRAPEDRKPLIRDALAETRRALLNPLPAAATASAPAGSPMPTQAEIVLWKSIENSTKATDFSGYLAAYPNGTFASVAKTRLDTLNESSKTPQQKRAEVIAKIVELTNNVSVRTKSGDSRQNVFAADCLLSTVRGTSSSTTIDLYKGGRLVANNGPNWGVSIITDAGGNAVNVADLYAAGASAVSQLFPLLAEAIQLCKGSDAGLTAPAPAAGTAVGVIVPGRPVPPATKKRM